MSRQRVLEIILAVVAIVSIPSYLINLYFSRADANMPKPPPSPDQIKFDAAFQQAVQLEQDKQYESAVYKFHEAEMYAAKLGNDLRYASMRQCSEHLIACNTALGRQEEAQGADRRYTLALIEEGEFLRRNKRFKEAVPKFEEAEERTLAQTAPDEKDLEVIRTELIDVYWNLHRDSEVEAVYARMIDSVHQPLNDYKSVLGEKHMEIAMMRSRHNDWSGAERSCLQAIDAFDQTLSTYPLSETGNARVSRVVAEEWLVTAYSRQNKTELTLSAAENAYQASQVALGSVGLSREISEIALQTAKDIRNPQLIAKWQGRLDQLPPEPCPVPNINNPACIIPAPATSVPTP